MNQKFLDVMKDEGPVTIVTINANPASVVNTWMSYVKVDEDNNRLYLPAAGMHSIENDFAQDNHVLLTMGSKKQRVQLAQELAFMLKEPENFWQKDQNSLKCRHVFPG